MTYTLKTFTQRSPAPNDRAPGRARASERHGEEAVWRPRARSPGKHEVNEQRRCATELVVSADPAHGFDGDELEDQRPGEVRNPSPGDPGLPPGAVPDNPVHLRDRAVERERGVHNDGKCQEEHDASGAARGGRRNLGGDQAVQTRICGDL